MSSKNNDGKIVIALIISLIAFGLGSGIGITVGMSGDGFNATDSQPVNGTIDVTNNISQDNVYYDMDVYPYEEENNESIESNYSEQGNYYEKNQDNHDYN
ncbi:hypothetical protein ALNOE001_00020 [Candidatus Methanobinarius endosymbioticus]|uniref:Uncharacterized protein n=1 Tax=Candidatus Methanobinarius endosymbioticus TaxID=2006182 RepID=A0A366ME97_9EURY|nr:hypothetical protein ALNOE001_00020 [Candidatus Methanobinarius endosymbioticus]